MANGSSSPACEPIRSVVGGVMAHPKLRSCSKQKWTANANYRRIPLALAVGVSTYPDRWIPNNRLTCWLSFQARAVKNLLLHFLSPLFYLLRASEAAASCEISCTSIAEFLLSEKVGSSFFTGLRTPACSNKGNTFSLKYGISSR